MKTANKRNSNSFTVQGRVFDAVTRNGLDGLPVTVYDMNEGFECTGKADLDVLLKNATRVGTVLSDENGVFRLNIDRDDIASPNSEKRRLDLLVVVSAPDDENGTEEKVLFYSNPPRFKAGWIEEFSIGLSSQTQKKFRLGNNGVSAKEAVQTYVKSRTEEQALAAGIADFHKAELERATEEKAVFRIELLNAIATNVGVAALPGELVTDNGNIKRRSGRWPTMGQAGRTPKSTPATEFPSTCFSPPKIATG
jgi:hypothetical protein